MYAKGPGAVREEAGNKYADSPSLLSGFALTRENFIQEAIRSVLGRSFPGFPPQDHFKVSVRGRS
jgi:hypothetical protein